MPPAKVPVSAATARLHEAIERLDAEAATAALAGGADLSAFDKNGMTPLCTAASAGSLVLVDLLLEHGSDVHAIGYSDMTALHLAARDGHAPVVRRLIAAGAPASDRVLNDVLHVATMSTKGTPEIVTLLQGVRISRAKPGKEGAAEADSRLLAAAHDGNAEEVAAAIAAGANVLFRDDRGMDPLSWAALRGHAQVASLLLARGVSPDLLNGVGWPPLGQACGQGHLAVVERLIAGGADVNLRFDGGKTALHCAAHQGHTAIVRALLGAGATGAMVADEDGYTPRDLAINQCHAEIVALLEAPQPRKK